MDVCSLLYAHQPPLTIPQYTWGEELGEPLNIIISGLSDPYILTDTGFNHYSK